MTTSTRFSRYEVALLREPTSFWRENVISVVILLRLLARSECRSGGNKLPNYNNQSYFDRERVKPSPIKKTFGSEIVQWSFPAWIDNFRECAKKLQVKSRSSSNLKLSISTRNRTITYTILRCFHYFKCSKPEKNSRNFVTLPQVSLK